MTVMIVKIFDEFKSFSFYFDFTSTVIHSVQIIVTLLYYSYIFIIYLNVRSWEALQGMKTEGSVFGNHRTV